MPYDEKSRRPQHDVNEPEPELSEHETVIEWERLLDTTAKPQAETSSAAGEAEEFAFDRSRLPDPFAALRHSVWSAARWEDLSEGEHRGTATLAEGVTVDLHCRHDKQRLELAITGLPAGWRAESLALVEPRGGTQAGPLTAEQAARLAGETSEVLLRPADWPPM